MKRADLRRDIFIVVGIYLGWTVFGITVFFVDNLMGNGEKTLLTPGGHLHQYQYFELFKELTPVVVLLPAAWILFVSAPHQFRE